MVKGKLVNLIKQLADGRYIFEKEGVYFVLTREQAESLVLKINEFEADKNGNTSA